MKEMSANENTPALASVAELAEQPHACRRCEDLQAENDRLFGVIVAAAKGMNQAASCGRSGVAPKSAK
jgi:hypothetical protein